MVPRALKHLFDGIDDRKKTSIEQGIPSPQFNVAVEFLELYNEEIKDLFNPSRDPTVILFAPTCSSIMNCSMPTEKIKDP